MVFDAESKSVLHTEMAKKNLFVKRGQLYSIYRILHIILGTCLSKHRYLTDC